MPTTYKVLGQSNPSATTLTTLYTVPSATQAATYIPGLPYGQGQETYDNQVKEPMQGNPFLTNLSGL